MRGRRVDIFQAAQLFDLPQSLKVRCIDEIPDELFEGDEIIVDIVDLDLLSLLPFGVVVTLRLEVLDSISILVVHCNAILK
jgi:hypothetical protein